MRRIVIVGNSAAALAAVESFRRVDPRTPLTLVTDEPGPAYSRVVLPHLVSGTVQDASIREPSYYPRMGVTPLFSTTAVELRPEALVLDDGRRLGYDALLLATGARAHVPIVGGIDHPRVVCLRTLEDARQLARLATRAAARGSGSAGRAVILGGGLVCFLVVDALLARGLELTILVSSDRVLSRMLDPDGAEMVYRVLVSRGVEVRTGWELQEVEDAGGRCRLHSRNGETVEADLAVLAKGVRANVDLAAGTPIEVDRGMLVDERMRTAVDGVLAAGDVAETKDFILRGKRTICATWFEAVAQGRVAGLTLAGRPAWHPGGLKMNVMTVAGVPVASAGIVDDGPETTSIVHADDTSYRKLLIRGDRITGAVFVGDVSDAGVVIAAMRRRIPASRFSPAELRHGLSYASIVRDSLPGR